MDTGELFDSVADARCPLAARMRPQNAEEVTGQKHLLSPGKPLWETLKGGSLHSLVLWGPPGSGKTTIASLVAHAYQSKFISLSATLAGVKEVRQAANQAKQLYAASRRSSILFIDEVHRFNKTQQDALSPHIEDGTIVFIGATTENPSFELNNALLSRVRVYVLKSLEEDAIMSLLERALNTDATLKKLNLEVGEDCRRMIARSCDGDARRALNLLEVCSDLATQGKDGINRISEEIIRMSNAQSLSRFDKKGDLFYSQISALHKSVRGSDPDAALYWLARMLNGGCDPLYIARRLLRIASEDIATADNKAWDIALNSWFTYERLGSPEGELALAHATVYLACSPKSNAVYAAFNAAIDDARKHDSLEVPKHLCNAPTSLMKSLGAGEGYRYVHNEKGAFAPGENYFPEGLTPRRYYEPRGNGDEAMLKQRLEHLRKLNESSR